MHVADAHEFFVAVQSKLIIISSVYFLGSNMRYVAMPCIDTFDTGMYIYMF